MLREIPKGQVLKAIAEGGQVYSVALVSSNIAAPAPFNLTAAINEIMNDSEEMRFLLDAPEDKAPDLLPFPPKDEPAAIPPPMKKTGKRGGSRKQVDTGKIMALHSAGWSNAKIADEMRLSAATVGKYIKQLSGTAPEKEEKQNADF